MSKKAKAVYGQELSKEEELDEVSRAFRNQFPYAELPGGFYFDAWIVKTYENVVIVDERGKFYAVSYAQADDEIKFQSFPEWEEADKDVKFETKTELLNAHFSRFVAPKIKTAGDWELDVLALPYGGPEYGKDLQGEFFTPKTDFALGQFETPLVVYYHGFDENKVPMKTPEVIGDVISQETRADGHWVKILLDKANEYAKRVWEAAKKGMAKASSGTIAHLARSEWGGEITYWPFAEITLIDEDVDENRIPSNAYAVAIPVMKALYAKAGINLPDILDPQNPQVKAIGAKQRAKTDEAEPGITYETRMQQKGRAFLIGE